MVLATVCLICQFFGVGSITARAQPVKPTIELELKEGLLTANIKDALLAEVMTRISADLGIKMFLKGDLKSPVTALFSEVPLAEAIRLLTDGHSLAIIYRSDDSHINPAGEIQIAGIWVFEGNGRKNVEVIDRSRPEDLNEKSAPEETETSASNKREHAAENLKKIEFIDQEEPPGEDDEVGMWSRILNRDENIENRKKAIRVLEQIGSEEAVNAIADLLKEDTASMRNLAVESLSRIQSDLATQILGQVVFGDRDPEVRIAAVQALGYKYGEASVAFLIEATKDPDEQVRKAARNALGQE